MTEAPTDTGVQAPHVVILKIRRFDPERDDEPRWERYEVPVQPTDRVLDALHLVKWNIDGSLTFRRSCAQGSAVGCDAHQRREPARLQDARPRPGRAGRGDHRRADQGAAGHQGSDRRHGALLRGLPRGRALADQRRAGTHPERLQSEQERQRFDDTTKCILCAACTTACPVFWNDGDYFGPAAIVGAHRFIFDSRDTGADERLEILNDRDGVWRCRTTFNCTVACPRGIQVTQAIQEVKRALIFRRT